MVAISTGVRNALASLQSVQSQSQVAQQHLATGKKVNSAVDNAVNYFTAAGLNDRSSQLSGLLDGMSNAVQTIQAASKGIDGITKLVQSLQSTLKQAQADAAANRPTTTRRARPTTSGRTARWQERQGHHPRQGARRRLGRHRCTASASATWRRLGADTALSIWHGRPRQRDELVRPHDRTMTVRDLVNSINNSGIATADVDDTGKLTSRARARARSSRPGNDAPRPPGPHRRSKRAERTDRLGLAAD